MATSSDISGLVSELEISSCPDVVFANSFLEIQSDWISISVRSGPGLEGTQIDVESIDECNRSHHAPSLCSQSSRSGIFGRLKVKAASTWTASHLNTILQAVEYNNDWTYTTSYWGCIDPRCSTEVSSSIGLDCTDSFMPWDLLRSTSPKLLFFKEIPLWEDELDDNGKSKLSCKIRVMNSFFYILLQFELRVDGVLNSRSIETRIFHHFGTQKVLREFRWIENGTEQRELRVQQTFWYNPIN